MNTDDEEVEGRSGVGKRLLCLPLVLVLLLLVRLVRSCGKSCGVRGRGCRRVEECPAAFEREEEEEWWCRPATV